MTRRLVTVASMLRRGRRPRPRRLARLKIRIAQRLARGVRS